MHRCRVQVVVFNDTLDVQPSFFSRIVWVDQRGSGLLSLNSSVGPSTLGPMIFAPGSRLSLRNST